MNYNQKILHDLQSGLYDDVRESYKMEPKKYKILQNCNNSPSALYSEVP